VTTVKVTNDIAERVVKLITDYLEVLTVTKDEKKRQFLLQGVELHTHKLLNFNKRTLTSGF